MSANPVPFFEKEVKNHFKYSMLRKYRSVLNCRRLLPTHVDEEMIAHFIQIKQECVYCTLTMELA